MDVDSLSIVIIDDDSLIRNSLKILLWSDLKNRFVRLKVYSSEDGVDGLGLIYVTNPQIIIIDSTLPKYSGREITQYLLSNEKFINKKIIILNDGTKEIEDLPSNYVVINKKAPSFTSEFTKQIKLLTTNVLVDYRLSKGGLRINLLQFFIKNLIKYANFADILMLKISKVNFLIKLPLYFFWLVLQIFSSILYSIVLIIAPKVEDSNIVQARADLREFRVKAYPTLAAFLIAILFILFQFFLFIAGGIVIFNSIRIESIFAANEPTFTFDFNKAEFDSSKLELNNGKIQFRVLSETRIIEKDASDAEVVSFPVSQESETDSNLQINSEIQTETYTYLAPGSALITFNQKVPYTKLMAIYEESSINQTKEESIPDINIQSGKRKVLTQEEITSRQILPNSITYQLSPDNINWYYYGSELKWEKTINEYSSSNTVQEVNQFLKFYQEQIGGNDLYIRAFINSDGSNQIELRSLMVEKILTPVASLETVNYIEEDIPVSQPLEFNSSVSRSNQESVFLPEPVIFSVSYLDGKNVVYGKILDLTISEADITNFKVSIYETLSSDIKVNATSKGSLIGESILSKNAKGEIYFISNSIGPKVNFATAVLEYRNSEGDVFLSDLSKPLGN